MYACLRVWLCEQNRYGKGNGVNGDGGEVTAMKMEMVMMMKVVIRMVMVVMMVLAAVIAIGN